MNIFAQIGQEFSVLPHVASWGDAQNIFQNTLSGRPKHWLLPVHACKAVGGEPKQAVLAVLAIACAHIGILLVDDMLDADPRGEYHRLGMAASANLSSTFQAAAVYAVARSIRDDASKLVAIESFNEMFLSTSFGQFLDVQSPVNESAYWKVTQTKSSPFFGVALQIGALAGGSSLETAKQLKQLGCLYGEMIQLHDDMHDSMEIPANPDWLQGRKPLPILFASQVEHPERERFLQLSQSIMDLDTLQEAQEILIHCGAISYCADQLIRKHQTAMNLLKHASLIDPKPVSELLDEIIAPVHALLKTVNVD
ncbi:MAG: polyprenyl synthetase family protein [Anaerolineales bacterium]|nr:polyprenyl synthetase family protein [Anaerolineales bacterium]